MSADRPWQATVAALVAARAAAGRGRPLLFGIAGAVAAGKTTAADAIAGQLVAGGLTAVVVATDAFLLPNDELARRGLTMRKGFPESFDGEALETFLDHVHRGRAAEIPVYSHDTYDRVPGAFRRVEPADVIVVEGVNVLQPPVVSRLDLSLYLDADPVLLRSWFGERFRALVAAAAGASFYGRFAALDVDAVGAVIDMAWDGINAVNWHDHIHPSRAAATILVRKGAGHEVEAVVVRPGP